MTATAARRFQKKLSLRSYFSANATEAGAAGSRSVCTKVGKSEIASPRSFRMNNFGNVLSARLRAGLEEVFDQQTRRRELKFRHLCLKLKLCLFPGLHSLFEEKISVYL